MGGQKKGLLSINWGGISIKGLAENAITYEVGEFGDTVSSLSDVVHIKRSKGAIVSGVTVNIVKGTENLQELLILIQTEINYPLTVNDEGMGFKGAMSSANATTLAIGDSSGGTDAETVSITFKGNLQILSI